MPELHESDEVQFDDDALRIRMGRKHQARAPLVRLFWVCVLTVAVSSAVFLLSRAEAVQILALGLGLLATSGSLTFGALVLAMLPAVVLDFQTGRLQYGRRGPAADGSTRFAVRKNMHAERFRLGVVEHLEDAQLASISVQAYFARARLPRTVISFRTTAAAERMSRLLASLGSYEPRKSPP